MDRGIAGAVATTNSSINIPDAYKDPRFNQNVDKQTGYRTKTILCVPMRSVEGEVVGVLQALNKQDGKPFNAEDEELLSALGGQAAAAVNNALLHQEIERMVEGVGRRQHRVVAPGERADDGGVRPRLRRRHRVAGSDHRRPLRASGAPLGRA